MTALIMGASGLVGSYCVQHLLKSQKYTKVISVGRRKLGIQNPKLHEIQTELEFLDQIQFQLKADDYFCCLGTTIKVAKTKENFRKVDYEAPLKLAQIAKSNNAKQFLIVTALGSDPKSNIFYSKTKGELETELKKLQLPSLKIFQPSMLLGPRKEFRSGEQLFQKLMRTPIWFGPLKKYKPIQSEQVARSMVRMAEKNEPGTAIIRSDFI